MSSSSGISGVGLQRRAFRDRRRIARHGPRDGGKQLIDHVGFEQVFCETGAPGFGDVAGHSVSGYCDRRAAARPRDARQFPAVAVGKTNVANDKIKLAIHAQAHGIAQGRCAGDVVVVRSEKSAHELEGVLMIFNGKNAHSR